MLGLYRPQRARRAPIRLLGVALSNLELAAQLELAFDGRPRARRGAAIGAESKAHGDQAIRLGAVHDKERWPS